MSQFDKKELLKNKKQLFIPAGFAHGFSVIANVESVVAYHQSELAKEEARLDEMIAKGVKTPEELEDLK